VECTRNTARLETFRSQRSGSSSKRRANPITTVPAHSRQSQATQFRLHGNFFLDFGASRSASPFLLSRQGEIRRNCGGADGQE
jgi:hypothetical protein